MTQESKVNVKNSQKQDLLGAGKIKLNSSHTPPKWAPPPVSPTAA